MAITTKIDPIERDIDLIFDEMLSPAAQSAMLADYARTVLAEVEQFNEQALGFLPPHETFVDGREGAALETVRPSGAIVFEFELLNDIFAWVGEALVQASPVKSGRYAKSHIFLADGVQIDAGAEVPPASEYLFVNVQPYARKIERGESAMAPDGVFQAVAAAASKRFSNIASISFAYHAVVDAGSQPTKSQVRDARQPAILIKVY